MANQPIPFKEHSTGKQGGDEAGPSRPPGEVGGHTVQPWEQDPVPATTSPHSKDVPPPEAGTPEAGAPGPGRGMATTAAPYNVPSRTKGTTTTDAPPLSTNPGGETGGAAAGVHGSSAGRPPRPPVYSPQAGHEPAPRPPQSHQPSGPGTEGDRLVEAITRAIADNIGKAFHQSVAQAVREVMPLSGRSLDKGTPAAAPKAPATGMGKTGTPTNVKAAPAPTAGNPTVTRPQGQATKERRAEQRVQESKGPVAKPGPLAKPEALPEGPPGRSEAETEQPAAAKPSTDADPSAAGPYGAGAQPSQFGGTIEAPDQDAIERAKRADGGPAAQAADAEKRSGGLA